MSARRRSAISRVRAGGVSGRPTTCGSTTPTAGSRGSGASQCVISAAPSTRSIGTSSTFTFPFILEEPGVVLRENDNGAPPRLDAVFEANFPTHSVKQSFWLDPSRRLVRHDYSADVIGPWATAANVCPDSVEADGLRFYNRRIRYFRASARARQSCDFRRWSGSRSTICGSLKGRVTRFCKPGEIFSNAISVL
jgi:hypothetical protein